MTLKEYKEKKMKDPEFADAYEEIQPEINVDLITGRLCLEERIGDKTVGDRHHKD